MVSQFLNSNFSNAFFSKLTKVHMDQVNSQLTTCCSKNMECLLYLFCSTKYIDGKCTVMHVTSHHLVDVISSGFGFLLLT